jgi:hypothetical protein
LNSSLDSKKSNCFYTGPGDELASAGARTRVRRMGKRSRLDRHPPSGLLFSYSLDNDHDHDDDDDDSRSGNNNKSKRNRRHRRQQRALPLASRATRAQEHKQRHDLVAAAAVARMSISFELWRPSGSSHQPLVHTQGRASLGRRRRWRPPAPKKEGASERAAIREWERERQHQRDTLKRTNGASARRAARVRLHKRRWWTPRLKRRFKLC